MPGIIPLPHTTQLKPTSIFQILHGDSIRRGKVSGEQTSERTPSTQSFLPEDSLGVPEQPGCLPVKNDGCPRHVVLVFPSVLSRVGGVWVQLSGIKEEDRSGFSNPVPGETPARRVFCSNPTDLT